LSEEEERPAQSRERNPSLRRGEGGEGDGERLFGPGAFLSSFKITEMVKQIN